MVRTTAEELSRVRVQVRLKGSLEKNTTSSVTMAVEGQRVEGIAGPMKKRWLVARASRGSVAFEWRILQLRRRILQSGRADGKSSFDVDTRVRLTGISELFRYWPLAEKVSAK
ncbi:hypothetical protein KM043_002020 [Ampulex compressa]|nr:hypothetical protein KM043_002020 [Ampulex compressa]